MNRVSTYIAGDAFPAAECNTIQDRAEGAVKAAIGVVNNDLTGLAAGSDRIRWQIDGTAWSTDKIRQIDSSVDWRDRVIDCVYVDLATDTWRIGQDLDYSDWHTIVQSRYGGYLGTGAYNNVITGALVADALPPVAGADLLSGRRSYFVYIDGPSTVMLYASPVDGSLWAYNNTGGGIVPYIEVRSSGATGKR